MAVGQWSVRVQFRTGNIVSEQQAEDVATRLPGSTVSIEDGGCAVQLDAGAETAEEATGAAIVAAVTALNLAGVRLPFVVGVETLTYEELDRRLDALRLAGTAEIAVLLRVSRQRADQLSNRDDFPRPVDTLASGRVWRMSDVRAWARTWKRERTGRPRKAQ